MRTKEIQSIINRIRKDHDKYLSIGSGWNNLVIQCNKELQEIDPNYEVLQVKEKYGGLRFYFASSDGVSSENISKMHAIVEKYEKLASVTCEETGKDGILMKSIGGWFKTLNPAYADSVHRHARYSPVKQESGNGNERDTTDAG